MRFKGLVIALIGMSALLGSSCSTSRKVSSSTDLRTMESRIDTVREQVLVAVHDSVTITKTITITENEQGDTVKVVQVTDRDRVRDRAAVRDKEEKVIVKTDTVYVERKDSALVQGPQGSGVQGDKKTPAWLQGLKWIFWIIVAVGVLLIVIKFLWR